MANGIEEVISTLYEMVQDAWSLPLGAEKCVVERDKVLDLLDEISNQLPGELKQAKTIVESRNEVITNAKREAESIMKQAEQRVEEARDLSQIYDENNEYREDFVMEVLSEAVADAIREDAVVSSQELVLNLAYSQGQWRVQPEQKLLSALSGGIAG